MRLPCTALPTICMRKTVTGVKFPRPPMPVAPRFGPRYIYPFMTFQSSAAHVHIYVNASLQETAASNMVLSIPLPKVHGGVEKHHFALCVQPALASWFPSQQGGRCTLLRDGTNG
jgi:hypothetical protein